jgi:hypothetical protein
MKRFCFLSADSGLKTFKILPSKLLFFNYREFKGWGNHNRETVLLSEQTQLRDNNAG